MEKQITRGHRKEGDNFIAFTKEEFDNGFGRKIINTYTEEFKTPDDVNNLLDKIVKDNREANDKEIKERQDRIGLLKDSIKDVADKDEYKKFKEEINDKELAKLYQAYRGELEVNQLEIAIKHFEKLNNELDECEKQMSEIKNEMEKENATKKSK